MMFPGPEQAGADAALPSLDEVLEGAWQHLVSVHPAESVLILIIGLVFLLHGFKLYKWLISVVYAVIGALLGLAIAVNFGLGGLLAMVAGALVLGLLAWPLHRAGWGLLGGAIFAVAAALLVKSQTASAVYVYVAAGAAFIAGLVLMVLLVRPLVILVTSVLGAVVVVGAVLALVPLVPSFAEPVTSLLQGRPETAVILVAVLAALGFFLQWRDTSPVAARAAPRGKAGDGHS